MKHQRYPNILTVLTALLLLALPLCVRAQFTFTTNNGAITITGYTGSGGNVTIPSATNGYPVTSIGDSAFLYCSSMTNVVIPDSITSIGHDAFQACNNLKSVTIPSSVTNIGTLAFACGNGLTNIAVAVANPNYAGVDGVLFNKTVTILCQFPAGKTGGYSIPSSVTSIGNYAFYSCSSLTNVVIGNSVTSIGEGAFYCCFGLTSVAISNNVKSIGDKAFYWCYQSSNVLIGSSVTNIGSDAFYYCYSLRSVTIPDSVTSIGNEAFYYCHGLTNVTIGSGVISIGGYVFYNCYGLTSVVIGSGVISIGDAVFLNCSGLKNVVVGNSVANIGVEVFYSCSSLTNIAVSENNSSFASSGGVLFNHNMTTLIAYPPGLSGAYSIPNSVTSIGDWAFVNCSGLANVVIGNSVTNIGSSAFYDCSGLTNAIIGNNLTSMGSYVFAYCSQLTRAFFQGNAPKVNGARGSADTSVFYGSGAGNGKVYYVPGTLGWDGNFGGWLTVMSYQLKPLITEVSPSYGLQYIGFYFTISWATNLTLVVEASTNLLNYAPVSTNTLSGGTCHFSDPQWTNYRCRFYRVRTQ